MENSQSSGISAIPVESAPLQKMTPEMQGDTESLSRKARWTLIFMLIFFPPYAWYLMAKYRSYHGWLANIILLNGIFPILISGVIAVFFLPNLLSLQQTMGVDTMRYDGFIISTVLSLILIGAGVFFKIKVKKYGGLAKSPLIVAIILLVVSYLLPFISYIYSMMTVIYPIYSTVSAIN